MKARTFVIGTLVATLSAPAIAAQLSPAMETVVAIHQSEFRGYKPGNKELRGRLSELGKVATPDEIEQIITGAKADWLVVDIRNDTQHNGGHILVDGKPMLHVGREKPTTELQAKAMEIANGKEILRAAPSNIVIMCRSGMKSAFDYASYAAAGFQDVKIAGILDWVKACKPLASASKIEDAGLAKKKIVMTPHDDGLYYWEECRTAQ